MKVGASQEEVASRELRAHCREVLRRQARSFRWASWFLPRAEREDVAVAYAFCRLIDDAVDEASCSGVAASNLAILEDMFFGVSRRTALVSGYVSLCHRRGISLEPAADLMRGARSDLNLVRVKDDEELGLYCYRVAGTVAVMMCGIFGVHDPRAVRHAIDLAVAMQITNICRDVLEDAQRDRIYVPETRLMVRGASQRELVLALRQASHPANVPRRLSSSVASCVVDLLNEAESLYESGQRGMRHLRGRIRLSVMIAAALYREIGVQLLKHRAGDALQGRVVVPTWRKTALTVQEVLRYLFRGRRSVVPGLAGGRHQ